MAYKVNDAVKNHLKEQWENACNAYLLELHNMWDLDHDLTPKGYGYWIGDEVGGVYVYGDSIFINIDDIRYCVENNVSYETYQEWQEYCVWANEFNQDTPNLNAWCKGCPRVDEKTQKKLSTMKSDLIKACLDEKEKVKNNGKEKPY